MTNDQIQQWVDKAGFTPYEIYPTGMMPLKIQAFATLVRNATLEEAATMCDRRSDEGTPPIAADEAGLIAEQIRSMK
jgi:hypothetical protein